MRRDRLLLISAFATALQTLLGAVGESLGMAQLLKSNTARTRTHSLFRQGYMLNELIPKMPEYRLLPLMQNFTHADAKASMFSTLVEIRGHWYHRYWSALSPGLICLCRRIPTP